MKAVAKALFFLKRIYGEMNTNLTNALRLLKIVLTRHLITHADNVM